MQMTDFCDHLYNESTDGYIQILKLRVWMETDWFIMVFHVRVGHMILYTIGIRKMTCIAITQYQMDAKNTCWSVETGISLHQRPPVIV